MEYRFQANEWVRLSPDERTRRCRLMAEEARLLSEQSPPDLKECYRAVAREWLQLAAEIERSSKSPSC
jgi:hypothetical protein